MKRPVREALTGAALGLLPGAGMGMIAAGVYVTWARGGRVDRVGLTTILDFIPYPQALFTEPVQTAALLGVAVALACAALAAALSYRPALDAHGAARWAADAELIRAGMAQPLDRVQGPVLGKLTRSRWRGRYFATDAAPHCLVAAPTGSGKGVGVVIPTLLTWPGSIICLDVKGENFRAASRRRRDMDDLVFKFAPYDDAGRTHRFNPLDAVAQARTTRRFTEARRLAASLIVARSQGAEGFLEGAREIFAATCVHAIERREPTIGAVYDLLSQHGEAQASFARMAGATTSPEARSVFNRMAATDARVLSSYLSVLSDGGLSVWADGAVRDATSASDFSVGDMRRRPASVFIVIPPNDLAPLAPLVRLIFQQSIATLQRAEPDPNEVFQVLFVLDEFASLSRMDVLSAAITTLRSFGGRVMIVVQSMANLRQHYGAEGAANFLANCGVQLFMAPADPETPEYVAKAIGQFTRKSRSRSWRPGEMRGVTLQERTEGAFLVRPEEFRRLSDDRAVALIQSRDPAKLWKLRYFEDRALKQLFDSQTGPLPEPPPLSDPQAAPDAAKAEKPQEQAEAPEGVAPDAPEPTPDAQDPERAADAVASAEGGAVDPAIIFAREIIAAQAKPAASDTDAAPQKTGGPAPSGAEGADDPAFRIAGAQTSPGLRKVIGMQANARETMHGVEAFRAIREREKNAKLKRFDDPDDSDESDESANPTPRA